MGTNNSTAPEKEKKCRSAIALAVIGAVTGLFIPFIGFTFALSGFYVNYKEQIHYETAPGYRANAISFVISAVSWILALILRPLVT